MYNRIKSLFQPFTDSYPVYATHYFAIIYLSKVFVMQKILSHLSLYFKNYFDKFLF